MADTPLFGIVPTGQPLITVPSSTPDQSSLLYNLPVATFSHIVVFFLPNVALPNGTAASIYLSSVARNASNFIFLGAIGPGKESAIFKLGSDWDATASGGLLLGITVENAESAALRVQELAASKTAPTLPRQPSTTVLAERIIQNAFNFLASFSGTIGPGGTEVVPLKAFEEWWKKFQSRIRSDPSFLEQQSD
ncbi:hypothetical protein CDD82_6020 [Ophiocordyceps australis]|uniref:Uncharacterized protein n=1 Tax=Ophiocordyceps australis TaxID=1399860 RepID=A0A2C5YXY4_9HYPO|nr:hypothetical protein CDD82_6020 [Ophiocordyceps australis]